MRPLYLLVLLAACGDADPAPAAVILEATPESLTVANDYRDDLTLLIEYSDGDADLGGGTVAVHDCRADDLVVLQPIGAIASDEAVRERVPIRGTLRVTVADIGLVTPAAAAPAACASLGAPDPTPDTATFCVLLTDAAGRTGPGDCTAPLAIQ